MKQNISEYWIGKENRATVALDHVEEMNLNFSEFINESIHNSSIYDGRLSFFSEHYPQRYDTNIFVEDIDSVSAILSKSDGHTAALNFASFKYPGGGFLAGSRAQEECLCHESTLYNVISAFQDFYSENQKMLNKALYHNRAIYSPNIVFMRGDLITKCDVITCASPNKTTAKTYQNVSDEENSLFLESRIKFILEMAAENKVDTLILGAFGCGVFGQDPIEVATIFKKYLVGTSKFSNVFKNVIFAIPAGNNSNLTEFRKIFS